MRLFSYIFCLLTFVHFHSYSQVKYSSVSNGSWSSSSTWDNGIPPSNLPPSDTIYINHEVIINNTQIIRGVLVIDSSGLLNNSSVDLFIGKGAQNQGELFNYGSIIVNKLDVSPNGCSSNDTKPVGYNFGDINCSSKLHIGKNCGSGFFYNYLGSNVNLGTELHLDAYLCNEDTIVVQNRIYNHGGVIECCGYFITPKMESNDNEGRPGAYFCSSFCTDQQTEPIFEVDGSNYNNFSDTYNNAPNNEVTFDSDSTLICDYNISGNYVDLSSCYIELSKSEYFPLCEGDSLLISIDSSAQSLASSSISWSSGQNTSSFTVSPQSTTTYTVSIDDGIQTCMESIQVEVVPNPVVSAGSDQMICMGDSTTLFGSGILSSNLGSLMYSSFQEMNSAWNISWPVDSNQYYILEVSGVYGNSNSSTNCYDPAFVFCSGNNNGNQLNGCDNVPSMGSPFARWVYEDDCYIRPDTNIYKSNHTYYYTIFSDGSIDLSYIDTYYLDNSGYITFKLYQQDFYSWNNGVVNGTWFSPSTGLTTFTLTGIDNNGCSATDQVNIMVSDPSFGMQQVYCYNQGNIVPVNIEDSTGFFSSSSSSLNFIDSITGLIDVLSLDTGFYRIYHNVSVCTDSIDFQLVSSDFSYPFSQYCDGDSMAQVVYNGNQSGVFSTNLNSLLDIDVSGNISIQNSYDTSYSIYYDVLGCVDSFAVEIISDEFFYSDTLYCKGGLNPIPNVTGLSGGVFSSNSPLGLNSSTGEIDLTNATSSTYTIYYAVSNCVDSMDIDIVSAEFDYPSSVYCVTQNFAIPVFNGTPNGVFSCNQLVDIDSVSGYIDLNNSYDSTYYICYQVDGCLDSVSIEIINTSFNYLDSNFCLGQQIDSVLIEGSYSGNFTISPSSVYIDPSSGYIDLTGAQDSIFTITHQVGSCLTTDTIYVGNPSFLYSDSVYCSTDSADSPLVIGDEGGVFTSSLSNFIALDSVNGEIDFANSLDTVYDIVYSVNNCLDTFSISVIDLSSIVLTDDSVCGLEYQVQNYYQSSADYFWSCSDSMLSFLNNTIPNPLVSVTNQGSYFINYLIDKLGCQYADSLSIKFVDSIYLDIGPDLAVNQSSILLNAFSNADFYNWIDLSLNGGDILSPYSISTEITNLITGDYVFGLTASNSVCPEKYDEIVLTVDWIFIPNGFSPNGDGINDFFGLEGARADVQYEIQIVNRWGELIFVSSDIFETWDGFFKGKPVIEDTYFYFIDLSGFKYKGFIELKR